MERKERELEADTHGQEGEGHPARAGSQDTGKTRGEVGHGQRPGQHVQEADPDQYEGGARAPHDEVAERRGQSPSVPPHGHQRVGGERGDLQEHEEVEDVTRDGDPEESRQAEQEGSVEERNPVARQLALHAGAGEYGHHQADSGHDEEYEGVDRVDPILDADGGAPRSHGVADGAFG